jgi:sortase A
MTIVMGEAPEREPHHPAQVGPRWRRIVAVTSMVAALAMFAAAGWELWGTNWVAHRTQATITRTLETTWRQHDGKKTVEVPEGKASALIRIPRFGRTYVVPVLEGTDDAVLAAGYGHYENAAQPGEVGNYALAAHRVTHGEPLRRMPELKAGDQVIVETRAARYTYVLDTGGDDLVVDRHQTWVTDPLPSNPMAGGIQPAQQPGQRLITLTTCSELFHTDDRMVAFGHLLTTEWIQR